MNSTKRKVVDSVFKNHKLCFIDIGTYRVIPVQICSLCVDFWPPKLWSRIRAPQNSVRIKPPLALMLSLNFSFPRSVVFEL